MVLVDLLQLGLDCCNYLLSIVLTDLAVFVTAEVRQSGTVSLAEFLLLVTSVM